MATAAVRLLLVVLSVFVANASQAGHPDAALLGAAFEGDLREALGALEHGGDPDARHDLGFSNGRTPLMIAAQRGDADIVALLLARGADPELTVVLPGAPEHGFTALELARAGGRIEAARAILDFERLREARLRRIGGTDAFGRRLVRAAMERTRHLVRYDGSYRRIGYPNGDVPADVGVCTDVVIRAYHVLGIDLQKEVRWTTATITAVVQPKMMILFAAWNPPRSRHSPLEVMSP